MGLASAVSIVVGLLGVATAQVLPDRVTNSRGCGGYGRACTVTLQEGLDVMATFTLDDPIVCTANDDFECSVIVNISNSHPHLVGVEPCFVRWDRSEWHQARQVRITAVQNYRSVAGEQHQIHLNTQVLSLASHYNNFPVEGFYIETTNRQTAQCRSTGDPHYTTFDGKYWHYYRASTVTLYRAPNRDFSIQTRTRAYPGRNCAIAGRENRDRVIIDNCGGGLNVQTNYHSTDASVHPRVQVSGNTYTVYFYSGAWVRAQVNGWGMNVYTASVDATPSNALAGHDYSCGLCGNFNGNRNDDVPGYRITSYAPLFPCMKVPSIATRPSDGAVVSFSNIWTWTYNEADFSGLATIVPLPLVACPYEFLRIDRPIINTEDVEDITNALEDRADQANGDDGFGFTFGGNNGTVITLPDYPLNLSTALCQQNIDNSLTVQACSQLYTSFNLTLGNYTEDCAEDYSHAGGPGPVGDGFLAGALRALEAECLQLAVQNNDTTLLALQQVLCDNACSQQGTCGAGASCTCNTGFAGSDCSIDLNSPPVIIGASDVVYDSAGLQRNHTPNEIVVTGTNFLFGNISCRFNDTVTVATYIGSTQILCPVPVLIHRGPVPATVPLQVSNNGILWSNASTARFIYYDGTCQACTSAGVCGPNPSTCIINNQCYLPHTQRPASGNSPTNPCQLCIPTASNTDWTFDYSATACHPTFTMPIYSDEIIGAAVAGSELVTVNALDNPLVSGDPNYVVNYTYHTSIVDPSITQWFDVHATTGAVTLLQTVNMSDPVFMNMQHAATNPQNFNGFFRVIATDQQGYTSSTDITIDLVPFSVHGAIFPALGFVGVIPENAASGTPVMNHSNPTQPLIIAPIAGSNVTVNSYEWFLQPQGATNALRIDPTTGAVTVMNGNLLDYETSPHLNYRIRATVSLQYITPLYIEVLNVDEAPTAVVTTPSVPSIVEGVRTSDFVANLSTVDGDANATSDGGPFVYSIVGDASVFELRQWVLGVSSTTYLAVTTATVLDFETGPTSYVVSVQSSDLSGLSHTTNITVGVTDVNEAPTTVTVTSVSGSQPAGVIVTQTSTSCTIVVPENLAINSPMADMSATDPDANSAQPPCYALDGLGKFTQGSQNRFMMLRSPLDYETNASFSMFVTCTDAVDFSLEATITCSVTVLDVPEAPVLVNYTYVGGVINETVVRTNDTIVGTVTVVDPDGDSNGGVITFTPPPGYNTTTPVCITLPSNALQCTTNLVLLPDTPISFVNSTGGVINIPVGVSQGGLNSTVNVNVTVSDEPELPSGFTLTLQGPLFETPPVDTIVGLITVDDPDSTPQIFSITLSTNPNGAFALEAVPGDVSSRILKVANSSAFEFTETFARRNRRQANAALFGITVCEPSHPDLGCVSFGGSVDITDRPLRPTTNTTIISPAPGAAGVQFALENQDITSLNQHLVWTLNDTTLTPTMGTVALSTDGVMTVTSPGGLCEDGGANSFLVFAQYSFESFPGTLPPGYTPTRFQVELTLGSASSAFPFFTNAPAAGFVASVKPGRASTVLAETTTTIGVGAPCGATLGYTLTVVNTPVAVTSAATLTGTELVRDGSGFIRAVSLAELQGNLQSGVWQLSDVFTASAAPTTATAANPFGFSTVDSTGSVITTGTSTTLLTQYLPSSSPSLPRTDVTKVLLAELVGTRRAVTTTITFRYLDACGVDLSGAQVVSNTCATGDTCVPLFQNQAWDYTCTPPVIIVLPPNVVGAQSGESAASGSNLGLWIGIVILVLVAILVAMAVYLRHKKSTHEEWDGKESGGDHVARLPTYHNPTYEAADGVTRTQDTSFRAGVTSAVYEWYKPTMGRKECTDHLMAQGEGSFVIRDSDSNPGWHMLGVKTSNRVVHDKIRLNDAGRYELLPSVGAAAEVKQPSFETLPELVDHYLLNTEESGLGYALIDSNPIYDNHQLVQERTGKAVEADYSEAEAVPEKRHYDELPLAVGVGDGVSNPMYGKDGSAPPQSPNGDGYLDVTDAAYESI